MALKLGATALALLCALALSGCGELGGSPPGGESVAPTQQLEYVKMPTELPDTFTVDPPEGWEVRMHYKPSAPYCWAFKKSDPDPGSALKVTRFSGVKSEGEVAKRKSPAPRLARQEVLNHYLEDYSPRFHELTILPDSRIGGEPAFGLGFRIFEEKFHAAQQEFYVIRHDGLWTFTLHSALNEDSIDPETYQTLDTFRWTGPFDEASVSPSVEPSPSESEG